MSQKNIKVYLTQQIANNIIYIITFFLKFIKNNYKM